MKKILLLSSLLLAGCPTTPTDCAKMCGENGVLLWHANSSTCVCQQNPPRKEPPKEETK